MAQISSHYATLSLAEFLEAILRAYPGLDNVMDLLADRNSPERAAFHEKMLGEHTGLIEFAQYGIRHRVARVSNVRGSNGYTEYTFTIVQDDPFEHDNATITYRIFRKQWEEWVTLIIA